MNYIFSSIFIVLIRIYQKFISPFFPSSCRYLPTCSEYACQAIKRHGFYKGVILTIKRVCKCHPWGGEGYDPLK